jgi:hypothetical protein
MGTLSVHVAFGLVISAPYQRGMLAPSGVRRTKAGAKGLCLAIYLFGLISLAVLDGDTVSPIDKVLR